MANRTSILHRDSNWHASWIIQSESVGMESQMKNPFIEITFIWNFISRDLDCRLINSSSDLYTPNNRSKTYSFHVHGLAYTALLFCSPLYLSFPLISTHGSRIIIYPGKIIRKFWKLFPQGPNGCDPIHEQSQLIFPLGRSGPKSDMSVQSSFLTFRYFDSLIDWEKPKGSSFSPFKSTNMVSSGPRVLFAFCEFINLKIIILYWIYS